MLFFLSLLPFPFVLLSELSFFVAFRLSSLGLVAVYSLVLLPAFAALEERKKERRARRRTSQSSSNVGAPL